MQVWQKGITSVTACKCDDTDKKKEFVHVHTFGSRGRKAVTGITISVSGGFGSSSQLL